MKTVLSFTIATILAGAAGFLEGRQVYHLIADALDQDRKTESQIPAPKPKVATMIRELKPSVTNLAAPPGAWVRLEAAILSDVADAELDRLAGEIATDTLAFLRTLSASDLAGAEGLRHLREDLGERAAIRSGRRVRELIIETMVVQ